jgi:hypothetical protein
VPSGNGSCLLLTGGDVGVQCRIARYASCCHGGMEGVNRGMDGHRGGGPRCQQALLFWCTTAQAINLARREEHMGKEMSTEGLVFDWTLAILRPKVTNRKHARTSRLRGPQPPNQPETLLSLSISALSPFTRLVSSASLYLHPLFQCPFTSMLYTIVGHINAVLELLCSTGRRK